MTHACQSEALHPPARIQKLLQDLMMCFLQDHAALAFWLRIQRAIQEVYKRVAGLKRQVWHMQRLTLKIFSR